jgi:YHYH protein
VHAVIAAAALVVVAAAPAVAHGDDVDITKLPVGKTAAAATKGGLWTCPTNSGTGGGGAQTTGPWFNGDDTYDKTKKYTVDGEVSWPQAELTIATSGDSRVFTTNDLPTDHTTGTFPVSPGDDAYSVDKNPNSIKTQDITLSVPLNPKVASEPSCVAGEVGILKSGVALFSPVDATGRDAVAYEVQDSCDGHPQVAGEYHYHSVSKCVLAKLDSGTGQSKLVGWAYDGFGIYGPRDAEGEELTTADLDECHGITSKVKFNGKTQRIYHYVATVDYPYTVGCFRGTSSVRGPTVQGGGPPPGAP